MGLSVQEQFGQIDIYVFDQILRGNIAAGMRVLDAGCGYGRNLVHLLREGCEVFAWTRMRRAWSMSASLSASLEHGIAGGKFSDRARSIGCRSRRIRGCGDLQRGAALFARRTAFPGNSGRALAGVAAGRNAVLPPRIANRNGLRTALGGTAIGGGRLEWFLVDEEMLLEADRRDECSAGGPVEDDDRAGHRCMTTWVLRKRNG